MGKIAAGGSLPVRNLPSPVITESREVEPTARYITLKLESVDRYLGIIAAAEINQAAIVEEYAGESQEGPTGETTLSVVPDYEPKSELITEVLVTGPVTTAFTLQLGDRFMSLSTDATGKVLLSPVRIVLGPTSKRILTSVTAGDWFFHLAGYALLNRSNVR